MRTNEEIEAMREKGKAFIKEHPKTFFGDDNVKDFTLFERIISLVKRKGIKYTEILINEAFDDEERISADGIMEWLRGDSEEMY